MASSYAAAVAILCVVLSGCRLGPRTEAAAADCAAITAANTDACVRLNEIQVLGTPNSYHIAPAPPVLTLLGARARAIEYTHRPLIEQLSQLGIRQFELDVFANPEGERLAEPAVFRMVKGLTPPPHDLNQRTFSPDARAVQS